jgi:hypothetical protein
MNKMAKYARRAGWLFGLLIGGVLLAGGTDFYVSPSAAANGNGSRANPWRVNGDGVVEYTNPGNDRALVYARIGGASFNAIVSGYFNEDVNMDGIVRYTIANNDRVMIYLTIGGESFNATVSSQVP